MIGILAWILRQAGGNRQLAGLKLNLPALSVMGVIVLP